MEHGHVETAVRTSLYERELLLETLPLGVGNGMDREIAYVDAFISPPVYWIDAIQVLEEPEGAARLAKSGHGVVSCDDHHRYPSPGQTHELLEGEAEGAIDGRTVSKRSPLCSTTSGLISRTLSMKASKER
jgi:hypothetical protein